MSNDQGGHSKLDFKEGKVAEEADCEHGFGNNQVAIEKGKSFLDPSSLCTKENQSDPHEERE